MACQHRSRSLGRRFEIYCACYRSVARRLVMFIMCSLVHSRWYSPHTRGQLTAVCSRSGRVSCHDCVRAVPAIARFSKQLLRVMMVPAQCDHIDRNEVHRRCDFSDAESTPVAQNSSRQILVDAIRFNQSAPSLTLFCTLVRPAHNGAYVRFTSRSCNSAKASRSPLGKSFSAFSKMVGNTRRSLR